MGGKHQASANFAMELTAQYIFRKILKCFKINNTSRTKKKMDSKKRFMILIKIMLPTFKPLQF